MFGYLFSFQGRTNRMGYFMYFVTWIFLIACLVAASIFLPGVFFIIASMGPTFWLVFFVAFYVGSLAITVRRLHDIDVTGWVLLFIMLLGAVGAGLQEYTNMNPELPQRDMMVLTALSLNAFVSFFYIMLIVWPSEDEGNRFG